MKLRGTNRIAIVIIVAAALVIGSIVLLQTENDQKDTEEYRNDLVVQHSYLLKLKLALVKDQRLDEDNPEYDVLKPVIEDRINSTFEDGYENYKDLITKYPDSELLAKTENIYETNDLVQKNEDETIDYLVELTNLLRDYQLLIRNPQG